MLAMRIQDGLNWADRKKEGPSATAKLTVSWRNYLNAVIQFPLFTSLTLRSFF
jgi:hypothetical protein